MRKHLAGLSDDALREEAEGLWEVSDPQTFGDGDKDGLLTSIVNRFIELELRKDFEAALLESSGIDDKIKHIFRNWEVNLEEKTPLFKPAVDNLKRQEQWDEVANWVGVYRQRIKGRRRLNMGIYDPLLAKKWQEYGLQAGEALAAYLYTGPCFMPYNCIYRHYPLSMVDLLKGDATDQTPPNTLSTTLCSISSALQKLARYAELPENGKVYRGLGSMALPSQFWIPKGIPA